jgi:hypothetical protein
MDNNLWRDIPTREYILYLTEWRSRSEIEEFFKLSPVSSWHAVRFLSKLPEIQCVRGQGFTRRCIKYKSRAFAIRKAEHDKQVYDLSQTKST